MNLIRAIVDLHIHSCYSRATSPRMHIKGIASFAKIKGLDVVGTGDFTHPKWLKEIEETLIQDSESTLYRIRNSDSPVHFILSSEVSTIFSIGNETKKIHHVIIAPDIEVANQINCVLQKYGDLTLDGRPMLHMSAPHLVEHIMQISRQNILIPAHIWTPWFSLFGAFSGFDEIRDCYQDMTKHIHALETGLSSDPPMNWRWSKLDSYTLVSNSDSHSFWPWRLGREANVFELDKISYSEVARIIQGEEPSRFKFTIETDPAYGKYHWTGHRNCNVFLSPQKARKFGNICPVCRKKLTKGVEQRIDELADRPTSAKPPNAPSYKRLIPLSEIIAVVLDASSPSTQAVWRIHSSLIEKFNDEYSVLMDASKSEMNKIVEDRISNAICKVRDGLARVAPGYDGVYGKLLLGEDAYADFARRRRIQQSNLSDFW